MRQIPSEIRERLNAPLGTEAANAAPSAFLRAGRERPYTDRKEEYEVFTAAEGNGTVTDCCAAVSHPYYGREDEEIWLFAADGGRLRVFRAKNTATGEEPLFTEAEFSGSANACAAAFDGYTVQGYCGEEFVTFGVPYLFWITAEGKLYGSRYGEEDVCLVPGGVSRVAAVRAPSEAADPDDPGLILFFCKTNGTIYAMQHIRGVWYDAYPVEGFPPGSYCTDVSAFRTRDGRIGVQAVLQDGTVYTVYSDAGYPLRCAGAHLAVREAGILGNMIPVHSRLVGTEACLSVFAVSSGRLFGTGIPILDAAWNASDGIGREEFYAGEEAL